MNQSKIRIEKLQQKLRAEGLDGMLVAGVDASFKYLLDLDNIWFQRYSVTRRPFHPGYQATLSRPECVLYVPAEGEGFVVTVPFRKNDLKDVEWPVIVSYVDGFYKYFGDRVKGYTRMGVSFACGRELNNMVLAGNPKAEIVPAERLIEDLRKIKDEKEISILRKAAALTDAAMEEIADTLKVGVTARQVEEHLMEFGLRHGAEDWSFAGSCYPTIRGCEGWEGGFPSGRDVPFNDHTGVTFDFGYVLNGYCSDYGRSFFVGPASDDVKEAYAALQAAQVKCIADIVPGKTSVTDIAWMLYDNLKPYGREHQLTRMEDGVMGHQIGIEVHELPWINFKSEGVFLPGMVFCCEPKLRVPGEMFMRCEDMVLITETGAEFLTTFDRTRFQL